MSLQSHKKVGNHVYKRGTNLRDVPTGGRSETASVHSDPETNILSHRMAVSRTRLNSGYKKAGN